MRTLTRFVKELLRYDERGASMVEYGLLLTLVAVVVAPALVVFGPQVAALYTAVIGAF